MEETITLVGDLGFPIVSSLVAGVFIFVAVRHILTGVIDQLSFLRNIIMGLENRISNMNNDIIRIDMTACNVLGIKPDTERIARAKGKIDARSD